MATQRRGLLFESKHFIHINYVNSNHMQEYVKY